MHESRRITRKSASNLALAFSLLPRERRDAMTALYAFCREVDDLADEDSVPIEERRRNLSLWRTDLRRACGKEQPEMPVNRELQGVVHRYHLPLEYFEALMDGVEMDLETNRYDSWEKLDLYCYRVASVVGLLSIEIFGYKDPACRQYAIHLGKALQLTNILRDVHNDAQRNRIYLPESELERFKVSPDEVLHGVWSPRYCELATTIANRAAEHYALARLVLPPTERPAMIASELMGAVYWRLLVKLRAAEFNVFKGSPIRLTKPRKLALIASSWLRFTVFRQTPGYGPARA